MIRLEPQKCVELWICLWTMNVEEKSYEFVLDLDRPAIKAWNSYLCKSYINKYFLLTKLKSLVLSKFNLRIKINE